MAMIFSRLDMPTSESCPSQVYVKLPEEGNSRSSFLRFYSTWSVVLSSNCLRNSYKYLFSFSSGMIPYN